MSPSSSLLLFAKTIRHPAARSLCDSWASCFKFWWKQWRFYKGTTLGWAEFRLLYSSIPTSISKIIGLPCLSFSVINSSYWENAWGFNRFDTVSLPVMRIVYIVVILLCLYFIGNTSINQSLTVFIINKSMSTSCYAKLAGTQISTGKMLGRTVCPWRIVSRDFRTGLQVSTYSGYNFCATLVNTHT